MIERAIHLQNGIHGALFRSCNIPSDVDHTTHVLVVNARLDRSLFSPSQISERDETAVGTIELDSLQDLQRRPVCSLHLHRDRNWLTRRRIMDSTRLDTGLRDR